MRGFGEELKSRNIIPLMLFNSTFFLNLVYLKKHSLRLGFAELLVLRKPALRQYFFRYMLCLDKHTAETINDKNISEQKFILFLPTIFLPTLISTFCIFPNRKPTQKMQKELIFPMLNKTI